MGGDYVSMSFVLCSSDPSYMVLNEPDQLARVTVKPARISFLVHYELDPSSTAENEPVQFAPQRNSIGCLSFIPVLFHDRFSVSRDAADACMFSSNGIKCHDVFVEVLRSSR